ncbi:MAG TPA: FecR domain-containing protein [Gemmatimonadaceae bacterium]|nr:FecR domain-containing protein [Gemmatimonadaceae bacterium]
MDEIIEREQRGEATPDEVQQLAEWRRASLTNEHDYRRVVRLLETARTLSADRHIAVPSAASVLARARPAGEAIAMKSRWLPWLVGAAAAAGLVVGIALQRRTAVATSPAWGFADVTTGAAEMTTVLLRDGSAVRLAPASRLAVNASDSAREVTLDGRAFFVVAKMANKPFVVHTAAGNARVLGTRFELSTHDRDLKLVVVEGRVALSSGDSSIVVRGGEQSGVSDRRTLAPQPVAHAEQMEQWVGKFLVFQSTPIRDAAREIERMYGTRIVIADSVVARRTVTATFTDQTSAQVLDVICSVINAQCETRAGEVVLSRRY